MAGIATSLLVRFMQDITDQKFAVTAMGAVTGQTFTQSSRESSVPLLQITFFMAGSTQGIRFVRQEHGAGTIVRIVTCGAFTVQIRRMGVFVLRWQRRMAPETVVLQVGRNQSFLRRSMRCVTGHTIILINRLVNNPLEKGISLISMAGKAEFPFVFSEQPRITRNMWVVTLDTWTGTNRWMDNLVTKLVPIVAFETGIISQGSKRLNRVKQKNGEKSR